VIDDSGGLLDSAAGLAKPATRQRDGKQTRLNASQRVKRARGAAGVGYACVVADPPWRFSDKLPGPGRGAEKHYPTMALAEIELFTLPALDDNAYLFLWRVSSMVEEAYKVVRAWGFVPKTEIVWIKRTAPGKRSPGGKRWFGMGRTVRAEHETCIVATRGKVAPLVRNIRSTFEAEVPARGHSAKPEAFYTDIVERLCAGPRLELFARCQRSGWRCMGNQLPGEMT